MVVVIRSLFLFILWVVICEEFPGLCTCEKYSVLPQHLPTAAIFGWLFSVYSDTDACTLHLWLLTFWLVVKLEKLWELSRIYHKVDCLGKIHHKLHAKLGRYFMATGDKNIEQSYYLNGEQCWPLMLVCRASFFSPATFKWSPRSLCAKRLNMAWNKKVACFLSLSYAWN